MIDFDTPVAPSGVHKGTQSHQSGDHMMKCTPKAPMVLQNTVRLDPKVALGALLSIILVDMRWIFNNF